jgi:hypothetical protein
MNWCCENIKMGVHSGNRPALPRDWTRGVPEGTSQGATPEDAHIGGRSRPFMKYPG